MSRFYAAAPAGVSASVQTLTSPPDGAWHGWGGSAFRANAITVIPYVDASGIYNVRTYPDSTLILSGKTAYGGPRAVDWHDTVATIRRSTDGKYVSIFMAHNASFAARRLSTNADDATAWGTSTDIRSSLGITACTYPMVMQLDAEASNPIYLIYRDQYSGSSHWVYSKSTDGGSTWAAQTLIWNQGGGYMRAFKSSSSRIDFLGSTGSSPSENGSVYHWYYSGGSWHKSDGTVISLPITAANATLVYDGSSVGSEAPFSLVNNGTEIAVVLGIWASSTQLDYKYFRYTSGSWSSHTLVTNTGTDGYPGSYPWIFGGAQVDPADINHVVLSKVTSGAWRIWDYLTANAGVSWTPTQITSSGDDDFYPAWIIDYSSSSLRYLWLKGTATAYTNFSLGIQGYGS